ncbi:MAG: hypothetical protein B7X81_10485 [Hydrogenophilales bacterium 17-61-76]|nr:MAG: hypothetical protein B7X81_10485 [Hydrogenophilales bacterium 17-61-76]
MMKGGIGNMMKQVQQVQENMAKMQAKLAEIEIEGQSGAGMVKVTMTCKYDVRRITIDPSLMGDDKEMLEDLVAAAVNDAVRKVESTVQEKMGSVTAGLPIPPGMKLNNFSEAEVCEVCTSPRRDKRQLAVVEMPADFNMMEATQSYNGLYFVLMGRLSPLDGIGPREIHLDRLISRALDGVVEEVLLATNFTPEGEATAHTIGELLKARGLKVSRLARGVPVGGELEYVDSGTLAQAVRDRRTV